MCGGYDVKTTDSQRDGICKGEPAPALGSHCSPLGGCSCGARLGRVSARVVFGQVAAKGPRRSWQLVAAVAAVTQCSLTRATCGQTAWRPRAPAPSDCGVRQHVLVWVSPGWRRAGRAGAFLGIGLTSPLLSVPYFDMFLKKRQKKRKRKKKTKRVEKKEKNGLRDIQGIFLCGHAEFL